MKVKVCGITNLEDALLCERYGADAVGFIFYKNSKRYTLPADAANIVKRLSPFTMKVGVFVDVSKDEIDKTLELVRLNAVQLHHTDAGLPIDQLNIPIIRAFRIKDDFDFNILDNFSESYFLLDSYTQNEFGGAGISFNWGIIPENMRHRIILAGGISSLNIDYVYKKIKPAAVDLSSSLEKSPGKKDEKRIKEFFNQINKYRSNEWSS
ncbi:MAG: phosphoribosylanthranilate isomerase [Ignavibacteriaceae bacterium]